MQAPIDMESNQTTAPTVTETDVKEAIVGIETKTVKLGGKKHAITVATLASGFTILASSTPVSAENYSEQIGHDNNVKKIEVKVWELLGFQLQEKLHTESDPDRGDALLACHDLLSAALGEDILTNEECENGLRLIESVLGGGDCQCRARNELAQLDNRIAKLTAYTESGAFLEHDATERDRQRSQLAAMRTYRTILDKRIANFSVPAETEGGDPVNTEDAGDPTATDPVIEG